MVTNAQIIPAPAESIFDAGERLTALLEQAKEPSADGGIPEHVRLRLSDTVEVLRSRLTPKTVRDPRSLFDLDQRLVELMDRADGEAGENGDISEALLREMHDYLEAVQAKIDRMAGYWRWQESIARICAEEAERLKSRQQAAERRVTRLRAMLLAFMMARGLRKLEGEKASIGLQANSTASLTIDDPAQIADRFFTKTFRFTKTELQELAYQLADGELRNKLEAALHGSGWEIDGSAVRAAIANNIPVAGARLVKGHHVRLR